MGRAIAIGVGALGVYGVVSALMDGNDAPVPEADHTAAADIARRTLAQVDWNRPIIAIAVPGTGVKHFWNELGAGLDAAGEQRVSKVKLEYPATALDMLPSVALGKESLQLVLDEIKKRDPDGTKYHVALQGESQGSWVINDVLAEHPYRDTVDRAVIYALPRSATHDDALEGDARVKNVKHLLDPITWPFLGSGELSAKAAGSVVGLSRRDVGSSVLGVLLNPIHGAVFGVGQLAAHVTGNWSLHPHLYVHEYRDGAKFMLEGAPAAAT